ncbi:MAG: hypothetical protein M3Q29_05470 [Chloroflexota bacterium]|nr:hypothetical protein [Chloroflexota bacterium]
MAELTGADGPAVPDPNREPIANGAAYIHWPGVWIGEPPPFRPAPDESLRVLADEMYRTDLPRGIQVRALREGRFVFDFRDWPEGRSEGRSPAMDDFDDEVRRRLRWATLLNAHVACLHTAIRTKEGVAGLRKMAISPYNLFALTNPDSEVEVASGDPALIHLSEARFPRTYQPGLPPMMDWRHSLRMAIGIETVLESFALLRQLLEADDYLDVLTLADLYNRSCKAFEDHDYNLCLITAWAIVENTLQKRWSRYIEANRKREIGGEFVPFINSKRQDRLTDGDAFTASVIIEVLSLVDLLPLDLYHDCNTVRKARNGWIHNLAPVDRDTAMTAVSTAEAMLAQVQGVRLQAIPVAGLHG